LHGVILNFTRPKGAKLSLALWNRVGGKYWVLLSETQAFSEKFITKYIFVRVWAQPKGSKLK
jgi:hypothetical protein